MSSQGFNVSLASIKIEETTAVCSLLGKEGKPYIDFNFSKNEKGLRLKNVMCGDVDISKVVCGEVVDAVAQQIVLRVNSKRNNPTQEEVIQEFLNNLEKFLR